MVGFCSDGFLESVLSVVARGTALVLEKMEERADWETDCEGGTSRGWA